MKNGLCHCWKEIKNISCEEIHRSKTFFTSKYPLHTQGKNILQHKATKTYIGLKKNGLKLVKEERKAAKIVFKLDDADVLCSD